MGDQLKTTLDEQHMRLAELLSLGLNGPEIAGRMEVTVHWVRAHRKLPEVMKMVEDLKEEALSNARSRIQKMAVKALDTIEDLLDSKSEKVALSAAKDVLDRFGVNRTEVKKIELKTDLEGASSEEIKRRLQDRLAALDELSE